MRFLIVTILFSIFLGIHPTQVLRSYRLLAQTRNHGNPELIGGSSHPCFRKCKTGDTRICDYNFTITHDTAMSYVCGDCPFNKTDCLREGCITAGGDIRPVIVANHMLPGPSIQVCEGDRIRVNILNALLSKAATIHWHGIHQVKTPYMDGTPFITQCPIPPNNRFQYDFTASPVGTQFWHSHIGFEEADGLFGTLIVRKPNDALKKYYDYDLAKHVMIIWHWFNASTDYRMMTNFQMDRITLGYGFLINGLASIADIDVNGTTYQTAKEVFEVESGKRYRFRSIYNTALYCPVQVSIDNHTLLMIASDTGTFEPVEVESFVMNAGERFDFVLNANQKVGNYWIRYRGLGLCNSGNVQVSEVAVLSYKGAKNVNPAGTTTYDDAKRLGKLLNPVQVSSNAFPNNELIIITDLKGTTQNQLDVSGTPDYTYYIKAALTSYDLRFARGPYPQLNDLSFEFPRYPFLTESDALTRNMYCTESDYSAKECINGYCTCPLIYRAKKDSLIEIVYVENTVTSGSAAGIDHPMHLHGYDYRVVAMMPLPLNSTMSNVKAMNEAGMIPKRFDDAPVKDCVSTPANSVTVLRFIANNPGYWFFHCHVGEHAELGMGLVFKIGKDSEMYQPTSPFPRCSPQGSGHWGHWDGPYDYYNY